MVDVELRPMQPRTLAQDFNLRELGSLRFFQALQVSTRYGKPNAIVQIQRNQVFSRFVPSFSHPPFG